MLHIQSLIMLMSLVPDGGVFAAPLPAGKPVASLDLATTAGAAAAQSELRYHDVAIIEADFRAAAAQGQPTGAPVKTYDYAPHAGALDFDDSTWEVLACRC